MTSKHLCIVDSLGKQHAWRSRMRRQGRCTKCGKKCLPYTLCQRHRFYRRLLYALRRGVKYGLFVQPERGMYAMGDEHAKVGVRGWYKKDTNGGPPKGFYTYAKTLLRERGVPLGKKVIADSFVEYRQQRAARGHLESAAQWAP